MALVWAKMLCPVDVRIITATNKDLETLVADGRFREDLFFRINVFPIYCPSLAERPEGIPLRQAKGNQTAAAKLLKVSRVTGERYGIDLNGYKP